MNDITITDGSLFDQKHALAIRIWHWVTFSLFAATIIVVLLANTLFDTRSNIGMVQDQAKEKGVVITTDQAKAVAHDFNDKLWNTHKIIGYFLCFSLLSRIIIEIAVSKEERLATKVKVALCLSKNNMDTTADAKHYLYTKYGYLLFYILFAIMASTGLMLAYEDVPFLKPIEGMARSIHGFVQYGIYGYILVHLGGVVRADVTTNPGIISRMVNNGRK
jgi:Ni/Fe-hydrogenase 1 B-type cytochrome subunit